MSDFSIVLRVGAESKEWWCGNPSGSRPNFFGRQHLTFGRDGHGCPKLNAQSFARMRNQQSVHMARMWCGARYYCLFAMVVGMERVDATEAIPPVVARILSGDSTSPLTREARI